MTKTDGWNEWEATGAVLADWRTVEQIAGPNDEPANPGGDGFDRLHEWITTPDGEYGRPSGPAGELFDEWNATGAVLAGRRTVEQVDHWGGDAHGVPIFVPSHRPPGPSSRTIRW
jgi:hypothetical protein